MSSEYMITERIIFIASRRRVTSGVYTRALTEVRSLGDFQFAFVTFIVKFIVKFIAISSISLSFKF